MPKPRSPRLRSKQPSAKSPKRKAALAMLWRFDRIRDWKNAVHAEAWRQTHADGSHHCSLAQFESAGARLEASGIHRPPQDWFDELTHAIRLLAGTPGDD